MNAADALADQPEPARTVAQAAPGNCGDYQIAVEEADNLSLERIERTKREAVIPKLLARIITVRQARQEPTKGAQTPSPSKASDKDLGKWIECTLAAVDTLAGQPEPAQTVANAAFGTCLTEEFAYQKAASLNDRQLEEVKGILAPRVLAQVIVVRAAHAELRKKSPETKPAIDYGRMKGRCHS